MTTPAPLDTSNAGTAMPIVRPGAGPLAARRAAEDFESFFVTSMLESMSAGLKPNKMFGGGQGEALYRSMLNQEYGKSIAARDSFGLTDAIQREILKMQERSGT